MRLGLKSRGVEEESPFAPLEVSTADGSLQVHPAGSRIQSSRNGLVRGKVAAALREVAKDKLNRRQKNESVQSKGESR